MLYIVEEHFLKSHFKNNSADQCPILFPPFAKYAWFLSKYAVFESLLTFFDKLVIRDRSAKEDFLHRLHATFFCKIDLFDDKSTANITFYKKKHYFLSKHM